MHTVLIVSMMWLLFWRFESIHDPKLKGEIVIGSHGVVVASKTNTASWLTPCGI